MTAREIYHDTKRLNVRSPALVTSDVTNLTAIDTAGFESLLILALVGASGDTLSGSLYTELELEHSDDNTNFTDCANTDVVGAVTGTNTGTFAKVDDPAEDDKTYACSYVGNKRYVKPVINVTGTHTNGTIIGIVAILGHARYHPVS